MADEQTLAAIVMASGFSTRFGRNKLECDINGESVIKRVLSAVPLGYAPFVVTRYPFVKSLALQMGFTAVDNDLPYLRDTVRLGLQAAQGFPAACFMVADQPWLKRETLERMRLRYLENPGAIVRAAHGGRPGNPVIFPRSLFGELMALAPDESGQTVIKRHSALVRLVEADEAELRDIDIPTDI